MRAVVQRVNSARVLVDGAEVGSIGPGLVVLLGVGQEDKAEDARYLAEKVAHLRIFPDAEGKMNRSLIEIGGEALVVSQFTLYGDCRKGRRPNFTSAAPPEKAYPLYELMVEYLRGFGLKVATGRFAADMLVEIHNQGPVTLLLDSRRLF
ncbi:MAG: D-aminoacyl-tRNA deacylase [Clostridia bacterium]|nr:D-aminoacyl-tRNA deacylase [Clostridia bacterium]MDH7572786.1 D-aminoacyl-tRNA deacylase [Clostridia bacterium]